MTSNVGRSAPNIGKTASVKIIQHRWNSIGRKAQKRWNSIGRKAQKRWNSIGENASVKTANIGNTASVINSNVGRRTKANKLDALNGKSDWMNLLA